MLLLNEQEMRAAVTCEDIMEAVEKAFLLLKRGLQDGRPLYSFG